jgi:hypothetical protein
MDVEELKAQRASAGGRRSRWGGKVPNQYSARGFKGCRLDSSPSKPGPLCQRDFRPRARPGETITHLHDDSVPAEHGLAESARSHDGAVTSVTSSEMPAPITASTSPQRP